MVTKLPRPEEISDRTISRALKKNWFYGKKKTYGYREGHEVKGQALVTQLSKLPVEKIVYLRESGMDNRHQYDYGWNSKGQPFHALKSGHREGQVNIIAALCNHQPIAPFTVEGACNPILFEAWLEACLLPNSPHLNQIEKCWSWLKSRIRKKLDQFDFL